MKRGGNNSYYLYDGLGSTRKLIDANQNVTDSYSYEAFGDITSSSGSTTNPYRYVGALGYEYSSAIGQLHVGARWLNTGSGRFTSQDPKAQGSNWYAYCADGPVGAVDPNGMVFTGKFSFELAGFALNDDITQGRWLSSEIAGYATFASFDGTSGIARWHYDGHNGSASWTGGQNGGSAKWTSDDADFGDGWAAWGGQWGTGVMAAHRVSASNKCSDIQDDLLDQMHSGLIYGALTGFTAGSSLLNPWAAVGFAAALAKDADIYVKENRLLHRFTRDCIEGYRGSVTSVTWTSHP